MKKFRFLPVLAIAGLLLVVPGCQKKKSCSELTAEMADAMYVFLATPSQKTCEDYYDAVRRYIKGCNTISPAEKQSLLDDLDSADCSVY